MKPSVIRFPPSRAGNPPLSSAGPAFFAALNLRRLKNKNRTMKEDRLEAFKQVIRRRIDMRRNGLTDKSEAALLAAVAGCTTLREINLSFNDGLSGAVRGRVAAALLPRHPGGDKELDLFSWPECGNLGELPFDAGTSRTS